MSARHDFDLKTIQCDSQEIHLKTEELETEWLVALLRRVGVSQVLIKKALEDPKFSAKAWRDFLFDEKGIIITRHAKKRSVEVFQVNLKTGKKVKIGQWNKPEIIRIKKGGQATECKLNLKYWHIV